MPTRDRASTSASGGGALVHTLGDPFASRRERAALGDLLVSAEPLPGIEGSSRQPSIDRRLRQQEPERVRVKRLLLELTRGRDLEQRARHTARRCGRNARTQRAGRG